MIKHIPVILIFLMAILGACQLRDLPPAPGIPGSSVSPIGKAVNIYELGYSEPTTLSVSTEEIVFVSGQAEEQVFETSVTGEQYVYKIGYVLNVSDVNNPQWVQFTFNQPTVGLSSWIKGDANLQLKIKLSDLNINVDEVKDLYIIAYACTKPDGAWNCHQDKWMIKDIKARLIAAQTSPEETTTAPATTCTNGVQDGDETGVDCGGSCVVCEAPTTPTPACTDSDVTADFPDGINYNVKGTVTGTSVDSTPLDLGDTCQSADGLSAGPTAGPVVHEYFCQTPNPLGTVNEQQAYNSEDYTCPNGCTNGACNPAPAVQPMPDLFIRDLSFVPEWNGYLNVFLAEVCNQGNADAAGQFTSYFSANGVDIGRLNTDVAAGECKSVFSSINDNYYNNMQSGTYQVTLAVDTANVFVESDETNNRITKTLTVQMYTPPPPVNGVCGTANNDCTAGTLNDVADSDASYLWECAGVDGGTTAQCSITKPLAAPTEFAVSSAAPACYGCLPRFALSWTASSGATSYRVYKSVNDPVPPDTPTATVTATTYYQELAVPIGANTFYYIVGAVNSNEESKSTVVSKSTCDVRYPATCPSGTACTGYSGWGWGGLCNAP